MLCGNLESWVTYITKQCESNYPAYEEGEVESEAIERVSQRRKKNYREEEADARNNFAVDDAVACVDIGIR
jgi:hypothetical protein